ncbi:unnamed protein product [Pleuronectes platessa]|uniref:Uncharacterized protein n=1 Tax=Pleuronectes platessa TaxID=8262 RepID=A0A9N7TW37_PLEPL|nr:unnamed protein product [Pleuronectes platessa]
MNLIVIVVPIPPEPSVRPSEASLHKHVNPYGDSRKPHATFTPNTKQHVHVAALVQVFLGGRQKDATEKNGENKRRFCLDTNTNDVFRVSSGQKKVKRGQKIL